MRDWLKRAYWFLGLAGNTHFLWFTLGVGALAGSVVAGTTGVFTALPWWSLLGVGLGAFLLAGGIANVLARVAIDGWHRRRAHGQRPVAGQAQTEEEASFRSGPTASGEAEWKKAAITFLTWLYRRDHWAGLSQEARMNESAPLDTYGRDRFDWLQLKELTYSRRMDVTPEPHWKPPPDPPMIRLASGSAPVPEAPAFFSELTVEQQRPYRLRLCQRRFLLIQRGYSLDRWIVDPKEGAVIVDMIEEWTAEVAAYAKEDWRLDPVQFARQLDGLAVERSQLPGARGSARTDLKRHLRWLLLAGQKTCERQPEDDPQSFPSNSPSA